MTAEFHMWGYWRDKKGAVEALRDYFPDVLAAEPSLRRELIRIDAYEALIRRTIDILEETLVDADDDYVPLWGSRVARHGVEDALRLHYADEVKKNEGLRVALENIQDARKALDTWMSEKAAVQDD